MNNFGLQLGELFDQNVVVMNHDEEGLTDIETTPVKELIDQLHERQGLRMRMSEVEKTTMPQLPRPIMETSL